MFGGTRVEVLNTDAEGRMILGDAIARACADGCDYLLETSTLTGGQVIALGKRVAGIMGTPALTERVIVLFVLGFPLIAAAAPALVFAPAGFAIARSSQHRSVERAQLALEQVLDRLERGEAGRPPTLLSMLSAAVRG